MKPNWSTKKLGELISFEKGKKMTIASAGEPYIGIDGLRTNQYAVYTQETKGVRCKPDDILLAWDGAHAGTVGTGLSGFVGSTIVKVLHDNSLENKFLFYILNFFQEKIRAAAQGAAIPHLSKAFVNSIKIPLPPLEIQKQIVERMDKIAEAQKLNDDLIQKSDELFQSLLHKELNPAGKDWEIRKLEDHAFITSGGTPRRNKPEFFGGTIPWVKSGELKDGFILDTEEKITQEGLDKSSAKVFPIDTVLIAMYGATVGKVGMLKVKATTNQAIAGIQPKKAELNHNFVFYFFLLIAPILVKKSIGGAQPNINLGMIKKLKIPVPPIEIQKQIVEKLSAAHEYKKQLLAQKSKLKELFDSVLHKSIKGELVK